MSPWQSHNRQTRTSVGVVALVQVHVVTSLVVVDQGVEGVVEGVTTKGMMPMLGMTLITIAAMMTAAVMMHTMVMEVMVERIIALTVVVMELATMEGAMHMMVQVAVPIIPFLPWVGVVVGEGVLLGAHSLVGVEVDQSEVDLGVEVPGVVDQGVVCVVAAVVLDLGVEEVVHPEEEEAWEVLEDMVPRSVSLVVMAIKAGLVDILNQRGRTQITVARTMDRTNTGDKTMVTLIKESSNGIKIAPGRSSGRNPN